MKGKCLKLASLALVFSVAAVSIQLVNVDVDAATKVYTVNNENELNKAFSNKTDDVIIKINVSSLEVKNKITVNGGSYTIMTELESATISYRSNFIKKYISKADNSLFDFDNCDVTFAGSEDHQIILDGKMSGLSDNIFDKFLSYVDTASFTAIDATDSNLVLEHTTVTDFQGATYGAISVTSSEYDENNVTSSLVLGEGTNIVSNTCSATAPVYAKNSEVVVVDGSNISNNENVSTSGVCAGIYMDEAGALQMNGGTITNNIVNNTDATETAGSAIYATGDVKVNINAGEITANKCTSEDVEKSSAIATANGENLTIAGGNIASNTAGYNINNPEDTSKEVAADLPVDPKGKLDDNVRKGIENLEIKRQFVFDYKYNSETESYSYSYKNASGVVKENRVAVRIAALISNAYIKEDDEVSARIYYRTDSTKDYKVADCTLNVCEELFTNGKIFSFSLTVSPEKFDLLIDSYIVVTINGVDYQLKGKVFSVRNLAKDYVNNAKSLGLNESQISAIDFIRNYNA